MRYYLHPKAYPPDWEEKIQLARSKIDSSLSTYENYISIDFIDVCAGGIQIRGRHKQIKGYGYPEHQPTIRYDFSNINEATEEFIRYWEHFDNVIDVNKYNDMLEEFKRWGTN